MTPLAVILILYYATAGLWQPIRIVPEQYPGFVSSEPMTLTARGNWLFAHDWQMARTIADMRYSPLEYNGNEYRYDHLHVYRADHLHLLLADVKAADLAIMTCAHYKDELGRVIYYFVKG